MWSSGLPRGSPYPLCCPRTFQLNDRSGYAVDNLDRKDKPNLLVGKRFTGDRNSVFRRRDLREAQSVRLDPGIRNIKQAGAL
jgi:hypothetical protein